MLNFNEIYDATASGWRSSKIKPDEFHMGLRSQITSSMFSRSKFFLLFFARSAARIGSILGKVDYSPSKVGREKHELSFQGKFSNLNSYKRQLHFCIPNR